MEIERVVHKIGRSRQTQTVKITTTNPSPLPRPPTKMPPSKVAEEFPRKSLQKTALPKMVTMKNKWFQKVGKEVRTMMIIQKPKMKDNKITTHAPDWYILQTRTSHRQDRVGWRKQNSGVRAAVRVVVLDKIMMAIVWTTPKSIMTRSHSALTRG